MLSFLRISADRRRLVTSEGRPFFYLADTAWELFHRLDREALGRYLVDRSERGFNVIQAVILAEADGLRVPNAEGDLPLQDLDPERPNEAYFELIDEAVAKAASLGLYFALLPTWGDKWNRREGKGPEIFTSENAHVYGHWLGRRYRSWPVIWVLGGDRPPETPTHYAIIRAMAEGLQEGGEGRHPMTFHPQGEAGSSDYFSDEAWLDFHSRQNCHRLDFEQYEKTRHDFDREPPKPVIDLEPIYEEIPLGLKACNPVYSTATEVRKAFYWDVFNGACGHAYGHHSIWQFHTSANEGWLLPLADWQAALSAPGAAQVVLGRRLMESRPPEGRIPCLDGVFPENPAESVTASPILALAGIGHALIYLPETRPFTIVPHIYFSVPEVNAWWFDPKTGETYAAGTFSTRSHLRLMPPAIEGGEDWVLMLDDPAREFRRPGNLK